MNHFRTTAHTVLLLLAVPVRLLAVELIPPFEATYTISRGGDLTAEQHSTFKHQPNGHLHLMDVTIGTHGLASFTGFERNESTSFEFIDGRPRVHKHQMSQSAAFSKRNYHFNLDSHQNLIKGKEKKPFELPADSNPLSAHLLPIWIGSLVCAGETHFKLPVLKSKRIKIYEFKSHQEAGELVRVERVYEAGAKHSTQTWFDLTKHCLPIKTQHKKGNKPVIETQLIKHRFIEN